MKSSSNELDSGKVHFYNVGNLLLCPRLVCGVSDAGMEANLIHEAVTQRRRRIRLDTDEAPRTCGKVCKVCHILVGVMQIGTQMDLLQATMKDFAVMLKGFPRETGKEALSWHSRHGIVGVLASLGACIGRLKVIAWRSFARPQGWILSFPAKSDNSDNFMPTGGVNQLGSPFVGTMTTMRPRDSKYKGVGWGGSVVSSVVHFCTGKSGCLTSKVTELLARETWLWGKAGACRVMKSIISNSSFL